MGIVLLGISTLNETGLTSAALQTSAHGLIEGALFLVVGPALCPNPYALNTGLQFAGSGEAAFCVFHHHNALAAMGMSGTVGAAQNYTRWSAVSSNRVD
ncbi:MAG: hypothetical protein ABIN99_09820 [Nitrosospira sp.]